jgi:hypothetical protein
MADSKTSMKKQEPIGSKSATEKEESTSSKNVVKGFLRLVLNASCL